jgi:UDP-glucose 4-epimerase
VRALVTGGAGFIGSHLVDALVERGDSVLAVDNLSTGREENLAGALDGDAQLTVADITDASAMERIVAEFEPEAVFHLAAQVDVRKAVEEPAFDAAVNVLGTVATLEAVRRAGDARFVFASTGGAIYGEGAGRALPLSEDAACNPDSPYGQSKLAGEGYVDHYRRVHRMAAVSLRLGNVYGPRQDPFGEAGVVAIFCGRISSGDAPVVFGDGKQTRDYVFVSDVVDAFLAAAAAPAASGSVVNVGTGVEISVLELYDALRAVAGSGDAPEHAPARPGELERIALDVTRAGELLGWQPRTTLPEGLRRTWEWASRQAAGGSAGSAGG